MVVMAITELRELSLKRGKNTHWGSVTEFASYVSRKQPVIPFKRVVSRLT